MCRAFLEHRAAVGRHHRIHQSVEGEDGGGGGGTPAERVARVELYFTRIADVFGRLDGEAERARAKSPARFTPIRRKSRASFDSVENW